MEKEQLISTIFQLPQIWDQRHKSHHNRYVLDKCCGQVADKCGVTVAQAKKTWKVLRQQFKVHFDKLPPARSGAAALEDDGLLEIKKEKIQMKKSREATAMDKNDEDVAFFTSLLPHVKILSSVKKLKFRMNVQRLIMDEVYGTVSQEEVCEAEMHEEIYGVRTQSAITYAGDRSYRNICILSNKK
ncbi:hypothetical protein ABEB36_015398 [Hypothenemus hampei]|uniref:MADF domain-containing protein n=1 Tax=Hypothenemus hampei TaxID=57062 RepID=A0ABD1E0C0_HYPHA